MHPVVTVPSPSPGFSPVTGSPSVSEAVHGLLQGLVLDKAGEARAAIALALAAKLDQSTQSNSGAVAVAAAGLAKELSATLGAILEAQEQDDVVLREIFGAESA
jgi:hypothetical protein